MWNRPHGGAGVDGVDVLTLSAEFVNEYLNDNLRAQLRGHGIDIGRDWAKLTNEEGIDKLRHAMGVGRQAPPRLQHGYVITGTRLRRGPSAILPLQSPLYGESLQLQDMSVTNDSAPLYIHTVDNLLKMLSVSMRMKCGLPVIVMGETGCGKSSLMRSMCAVLGWRLHTLNIHGGMDDVMVIAWVKGVLATIAAAETVNEWGEAQTDVVFLDEVNTCNSMGLFKEMLCDGSMNGQALLRRGSSVIIPPHSHL